MLNNKQGVLRMNTSTYVEQFWAMILNNQVAATYRTIGDMQQALVTENPQQQQIIMQAYEIVRQELVGRG